MNMRRIVLSVMVLLFCRAMDGAPIDPKPKVRIAFTIEAAGIRSDLDTALASCITDVQAAVKAALETRFPYFEWVTAGDAAQTLTLTLKERPGSGDIETVLVYTGTIGTAAAPLHVLYPWTDPPPADPAELKTDLTNRIAADVARSELELKGYFISHVPVVRRIDVESKFIVLPVDIHPASGSFVVDFSDASARPGEIRLSDPFEGGNGVFCSIQRFRYPGDPPIDDAWNDAIPTVVRQKAQKIEVKVMEYTPKAHVNTSGGSVTALPDGGTR